MDIHHPGNGRLVLIHAAIHGPEFHLRLHLHDDKRRLHRHHSHFLKDPNKHDFIEAPFRRLRYGHHGHPNRRIIVIHVIQPQRLVHIRNLSLYKMTIGQVIRRLHPHAHIPHLQRLLLRILTVPPKKALHQPHANGRLWGYIRLRYNYNHYYYSQLHTLSLWGEDMCVQLIGLGVYWIAACVLWRVVWSCGAVDNGCFRVVVVSCLQFEWVEDYEDVWCTDKVTAQHHQNLRRMGSRHSHHHHCQR